MNLLKILNEENVSEEELKNYEHRNAVRIVVFDNEKKIAFIHATINKYYELPGGGVEDGETIEEGAIREAKEETGCDVKITGEVGIIQEYMKDKELINETHCFLAEVIGNKCEVRLNQDEINRGMIVIWVSVEEAIKLMDTNRDDSLKKRELTFLNKIV